jgi:uncharacterized protein YegJ (DUF2314 family)
MTRYGDTIVTIPLWTGIALTALLLGTITPISVALAQDSGNLKHIPTGDPEMAAAAAKARAGLDDFLTKLDSPPAGTENYSVKIGIVDKGDGIALTGMESVDGVEYFWVGNIRREGDGFLGTIGNEPQVVRNARMGQEISFVKNDIFDWMYFRDSKIVGNITACPLLLKGSKEELEFYRTTYGLEC